MSQPTPTPEVVRSPRSNVLAGLLSIAAGLFLGVFALSLLQESSLSVSARALGLVIASLMGALASRGGLRLMRGYGGLFFDAHTGDVGVGLTGPDDVWRLPKASLLGIIIDPLEPSDPEPSSPWLIALALDDGVDVVLEDMPDKEGALDLASHLGERLRVPVLQHRPACPTITAKASMVVAVQRGAALNSALLVLGIAFATVGWMLYMRVSLAPAVGFLVGPFVGMLGVLLLAVGCTKRLAVEEVVRAGSECTHRFRLGSHTWGSRTITAHSLKWRVRTKGIRGAHLEILGDTQILIAANGATTKSQQGIDDLKALPARFAVVSSA